MSLWSKSAQLKPNLLPNMTSIKNVFLLVKSQQKCPWDMSAVESAVKTFLSGQQFVKHGGPEVVECFSLLSALL